MLVFHVIILVILYILVSQNIQEQKKSRRERERGREGERVSVKKSMKLTLVLGAYDLNFSTTLSKLNIVLQQHLGFLKGMFREDIEPLYVLFVFIYIFGKCLIFLRD